MRRLKIAQRCTVSVLNSVSSCGHPVCPVLFRSEFCLPCMYTFTVKSVTALVVTALIILICFTGTKAHQQRTAACWLASHLQHHPRCAATANFACASVSWCVWLVLQSACQLSSCPSSHSCPLPLLTELRSAAAAAPPALPGQCLAATVAAQCTRPAAPPHPHPCYRSVNWFWGAPVSSLGTACAAAGFSQVCTQRLCAEACFSRPPCESSAPALHAVTCGSMSVRPLCFKWCLQLSGSIALKQTANMIHTWSPCAQSCCSCLSWAVTPPYCHQALFV